MGNILYQLAVLHSRISSWLSSEKYLHQERFANPSEVKHLSAVKPHDYGLILGADQFGRILQITETKARKSLGNILKVGPSQCGKSTDFKFQLRHFKGSAVVNDVKGGELSRETAKIRSEFSDIYNIDPTGRGNRHDPLRGKTSEHELYAVAELLLHEPKEGEGVAFTQKAIKMLTLLFLAARRKGDDPFPFVAHMSRLGVNSAAQQIQAIAPDIATQLLDGEYNSEKDYGDNKYLANSWELLTARMYSLLTETVVRSLTGSDFQIADLLTGERPVTIYLNWPESDLHALKPLMKLFWGTLVKDLKTIHKDLTKRFVRPKLHKILFLIDEGGVTHIPELYDHVSTVNSFGMSFVMGIQDLSQLDAQYGEYNAQTILNNCSKVFFRQESLRTAKIVSEYLGPKSGFASSQTSHGDQTSEGKQEREIPLMSPQEIRGMPEDDIIIFHRGMRYAIKAKRVPLLEQEAVEITPSLPLFLPSGEKQTIPIWRHNPELGFTYPSVSADPS